MRWSLAVVVLAAGCAVEEPACVPFEDAFDANVTAILDAKCGSCHGETPEFGAPYPLVDYGDMLKGADGERHVDAMLAALLDGSMPPGNSDPLTHTELDTLVGWASCGLLHPEEASDLEADRPVWEAGAEPPAGTTAVALTAEDERVGPRVLDDYRTFSFTNVVDEPLFIRRIEPIIDESRVLHHITLTYRGGWPYLYAWAPGTGPIAFDGGGMAIAPGDAFEVEIHYNNGAGIRDVRDSSGVRLWVGPQEGIEYGMASPSTWEIAVPPGESSEVTHTCRATQEFDIIAGMPHMHEIGSTFEHTVERADGTIESLVALSGWSFESQYFYEMGVHINVGDTLRMTCGYENTTTQMVVAGLKTTEEMCFDFMVVQPASASSQCAE